MATLVATAFFSVPVLGAQTPPLTPPAPNSRADNPGVRQSITWQTTVRRYRVGDADVAEQAAPIAYRLVAGAATLRLNVVPVDFSAASTTIRGTTPFSARLDYRLAHGNSLRVYGQTPSAPATLDTGATAALGAVGTPTLDIESLALGTPALIGARAAHETAVRSAVASVHGAVELEPRPSGNDPVYWLGTTVKVGASLTGNAGTSRLGATLELSRSFADELDGRNLFPGGGTVSLSATGGGPVREDSDTYWQVFGFYFRPISSAHPDQPNRIIPVGDFMGVNTSLSIPAGLMLFWPSVEITREASHTVSHVGATSNRIDGSGWTTNAAMAVTLPGRHGLDLTPSAGYVFGSVGARFTSTTSTGPGLPAVSTDAFSDRIRGWWASLELSAHF